MALARVILLLLLPGSLFAQQPRRVHVLVALCDNQHQGIVPVPAKLGNGEDPDNNLYWGALYGMRTHLKRGPGWALLSKDRPLSGAVIERVLFRYQQGPNTVYLLAEAYRGSQIKQALTDFLNMLAGHQLLEQRVEGQNMKFGSGAGLVAFVGHNGLMDFELNGYPSHKRDSGQRDAIVLACKSRDYFKDALQKASARPLVWSTGLMAAEAYPLRAAVEGWAKGEDPESIRLRAARAYASYQKCSLPAAKRLLVTGVR